MEVRVRLELFVVDPMASALTSFCEAQVRRALHRDRLGIDRVDITLRRDARVGVGERWAARIELHLKSSRVVRAAASRRRPHQAIEEVVLSGWTSLHAADARAVA